MVRLASINVVWYIERFNNMTQEAVPWDLELTNYVQETDGLTINAVGLSKKPYTFHFKTDSTKQAWLLDDNGVSAIDSVVFPRHVNLIDDDALVFTYDSELHKGNNSIQRRILVRGQPDHLRQIFEILKYERDLETYTGAEMTMNEGLVGNNAYTIRLHI